MRRGTPGLGDVHAEALRAGASDSSRDSEEASGQSRGRKRKEDAQQCGSRRPRRFDFHRGGDGSY